MEIYSVNITDATEWEFAFLYVYPGHIIDAVNESYNYGVGDVANCIKKTTVHEFGHILGLMHPTNSNVSSVMHQGLSTSYTPSQYDKDDLHNQWCT